MDAKDMINSINSEGFAVIEDFVSKETLDKFMPEVYRRFDRLSYNGTKGYVKLSGQKYLQDTLTVHKEILKIYLHPFIIDCCEEYTGKPVHLSDYRIYQNLAGHQMPWHVDNKQTMPDQTEKMLDYKGLITLIYLDGVDHGPFQLVRGSHLWASGFNKEMWDDVIEKYSKDIVTFNNQKAGTAIIYDTRGIHRAEPFQKGSPRTALFAQYADLDKPTGEPIFINTEHGAQLSEKTIQVLRFGKKASAPTWPIPADKIQNTQRETRRSSYLSMIKSLIRTIRACLC
jgi:ectoine hydroxylase-related dioxygenase (phytanoyl-CoA dioxygenase family)